MGLGLSYGEPLGIGYLAAMVEKDGYHNVKVIDSPGLATCFPRIYNSSRIGLPEDEIVDLILEGKNDIIGISLISSMYAKEIYNFIIKLKKMKPATPIVIGGAHATLNWEDCINSAPIDYIVLGEGEETIIELLNTIEGGYPLSQVRGIVYREKLTGFPVKTDLRNPAEIDNIPWPARHLLPMKNYFKNKPSHYYMRKPIASIFTSRGCPFNCIFCTTTLFWKKQYRARNPIDVVNEMEHLVCHYGIREFHINDDCFLGDKKRAAAICDEIINRRLNIKYQIPPGINLNLLDEELLFKFEKSGLYAIRPQFESGNPKTLKYMRKNIDLEKSKKVISYANKLGMWTQTNILIGFPDETREDIEMTAHYIEHVGIDRVDYNIAIPYPSTDLRKDFLEKGLITSEGHLSDSHDTLHIKATELEQIRARLQTRHQFIRFRQILNIKYFFSEFFPKINSIEKISFLMRRVFFELKSIFIGRYNQP